MSSEQEQTSPKPLGYDYPVVITKWVAGYDPLNFKETITAHICGSRYQGKSGLAESLATCYKMNGSTIYDLGQSADNEALAWLDSPYRSDVILIHGDETKLLVPQGVSTRPISSIHPETEPNGKIFIMPKAFFKTHELYYRALIDLTDGFQRRDTWDAAKGGIHVIMFREFQEYVSSKLTAGRAPNSRAATDDFVKFHNQLYHFGYALIADSQRRVGVAKDVRELVTHTFYKRIGRQELPRELYHWGRRINLDGFRHISKSQFILDTDGPALAFGYNLLPSWHLKRGSSIIGRLGIAAKFDDAVAERLTKEIHEKNALVDRRVKIGLREHEELIQMLLDGSSLRDAVFSLGFSEWTGKYQKARHVKGICRCSLPPLQKEDDSS
jgi:hypothetical protein